MKSTSRRRFENQRWAVFISGRGSNLQNLLDLIDDPRLVLILSNQASAPGLKKARRSGISVKTIAQGLDWKRLSEELRQQKITQIFLLGFMKIIPENFVADWRGRLWNVHPSCLPLHPGLHGFEKSFEGNSPLGATVHEVTEEMDAGGILFQGRFARREESLEHHRLRLTFLEHRLVREVANRCS